jgi:ATP-dependent helicase Lhr and Lhr-like helicase
VKHPAFPLELGAFFARLCECQRARGPAASVRTGTVQEKLNLDTFTVHDQLGIDVLVQFAQPPYALPLLRHTANITSAAISLFQVLSHSLSITLPGPVPMALQHFHPIVARWFTETLGEPTPAQRRGWTAIAERRHTLIAAPTGSGKTLAAFLIAIDELVKESLDAPLPDEVRVVYVSPLKALSADIHKNLAEPRRGIRRLAEEIGMPAPRVTAAVRTGDTPQAERAAMVRTPPHILVTTPESLYLLLTAERTRQMLRTARTVIVDEIHAVIGTRRGAHLAITLERLQHVAERQLVRIGLSATQKPIEKVARFLAGSADAADAVSAGWRDDRRVAIVDEGHARAIDLAVEMPNSTLESVMSHEVWGEYYARLTELIESHRTTLVFVNTRRMAERVARHLSERLGEEAVTAHHGSLSKEKRLDAESRLKAGTLKALVATASLELGIDIGHVDLVCQLGSPHRIATLLQRVGRSGHTVSGMPKGRVFPVSRDDLIECAAMLRAVRRGELDLIVEQDAPLDVLAQQVVAESAAEEYTEDELFALIRQAWPYRNLARGDFDAVVQMTSQGFATRRGRRGALVHRDEVQRRVRGRRSARQLAITSGGAIPEVADYRVVLDPEDVFIGTLNEDFAIESTAGDVFQLGNASWQVLQVGTGVVRVADAKGAPPTLPFWLGEAPARSNELSRAVSDLRAECERLLDSRQKETATDTPRESGDVVTPELVRWLVSDCGLSEPAAEQAAAYLVDGQRALGAMPTQDTLVLERFFDESGGMQLVLHAPFGSRINKAWGLALRKRFCRQFNFELQAAATDEALLLSLGPQHSFPLSDVFRYLHPATARDVLVQAFLDAPVFQTRWRWNTTISLAVPRNRHGKKIAPQLQRMQADDLMAAVFPDAAACLENIPGDRQIPDHPLVNQTVRDCLEEAMDFEGLCRILTRIHERHIRCVSRDTPEPSPFCHEILNARPYAFLDDAPLEERRTQAVYARRATDRANSSEIGQLDPAAITRVRGEQQLEPRDADELHDSMLTVGFLTAGEVETLDAAPFVQQLMESRRIGRALEIWITAERLPELLAIHPGTALEPAIAPPATRTGRAWTRDEAIVELLRGRVTLLGPTTAAELAQSLSIPSADAEAALLALESEGVVLRGQFSAPLQWCDRALLARIHRYTLNRLRAEIEPVSPADFMRFLFHWQHADPSSRLTGIDGLRAVIATLDGFEAAAGSWERAILPQRMDHYDPTMLDTLCLAGEVGWARVSASRNAAGAATATTSTTPVSLCLRQHIGMWEALARATGESSAPFEVSADSQKVLDLLLARGASFFRDIVQASAMQAEDVRKALGELSNAGLVASDGFAGLRAIIRNQGSVSDRAGRWSVLAPDRIRLSQAARDAQTSRLPDDAVETQAWALLRRYGVISRRLLDREANPAPWRALTRVYRRLEARGEIRGGRFVTGMSGEQYALPEAVERLREVRRTARDGRLLSISAADPLNLAGVVDSGERVRIAPGNRLVYRDGVPLAALEGDYLRPLADMSALEPSVTADLATTLAGRPLPAVTSGFVGRT